jgi:hypothetical protein
MAQNRTCNLSATSRPASPLRQGIEGSGADVTEEDVSFVLVSLPR